MSGEQGHTLDIDSVTHRYGPVTDVAEVSLAVRAGEIVALLGPSGCGKTTLLRVVAGFIRQSAGSVRIDGKPIDHLPANLRNVGIVFQSYALFPHMTVAHNVAYGLQARGVPRSDVRRTVQVVRAGRVYRTKDLFAAANVTPSRVQVDAIARETSLLLATYVPRTYPPRDSHRRWSRWTVVFLTVVNATCRLTYLMS